MPSWHDALFHSHLVTWQGIGHCLMPEGPVGKGLLADYEQAKKEHHLMNYTEQMARYGHALRGPPPPPPPWSMVQDAPPPVGWSVGSLFPLWGGCGGFGFWV